MNGSENIRRLAPFHRALTERAGVAGLTIWAMFLALIAGTASAAPDEAPPVQVIGEGRSFVDVAPGDAWQPDGFPGARVVRAVAVPGGPIIDGLPQRNTWLRSASRRPPTSSSRLPLSM